MKKQNISRREFMGRSAAAAAGLMIIPRHVLGGPGFVPPSDTINIGCIGVGGKGSSDIRSCSGENIVALCDVHESWHRKAIGRNQKLQGIKLWTDYREMFDKHHKDNDPVMVATSGAV